MDPPERVSVPTCIGCGAMSRFGACAHGCSERRLDLVRASAYDSLEVVERAAQERIEALIPVVKPLIGPKPKERGYEAAFEAVRAHARQAVLGVAALGEDFDVDVREPAEAATTWWCPECGGIDAPQPCLGICVWREVLWVQRAAYEHRRQQVLARADLARRLLGLTRRLARVTPRQGQWERNWIALKAEATEAIRGMDQARRTPATVQELREEWS